MRGSLPFAIVVVTAISVFATLILERGAAVAQGPGMMGGGCMGMNCPGGPGRGMVGENWGSMPRHHQFMMGGVPEPYASMSDPLPNTSEVIARGRTVFEENCASCHGPLGLGDGEAGRQLSPPPTNLAALTQMPMMRSDSYLYWAIAEGGAPFGTAMPAQKDIQSAEDTWSVIRFLQAGLPQDGAAPR